MGNADSKRADSGGGGGAAVNRATSKESHYTGMSSFDGEDDGEYRNGHHHYHSRHDGEEKKELENMVTPRTKTGRKNGAKSNSSNHRQSRDDDGDDDDDDDMLAAGNTQQITDDQVHVNLAMADLMAYLQVVANNSNHLPLTRRDDPELDRMVSALTPEDYARKSAAFIPADVRVVGATFTRYGRVWDLPTSEEYNACDGAHEPGRSYGGACCNAMLKVLYDAANDVTDAAQTEAASQALFDDDEDDEEETSTWMGKSYKSGFSLEFATPNPSTITWADLLRKMKAEIKDIEYAQVPKITTTRKMDLNKPFSLFPDDFDPTIGKKRSLLIGCNYTNIHGAELKASHDDVRSMKDYIVNVHGFPEGKGLMTVLMDNDDYKHPTFLNITEAFKALSEESQPGDAVFVLFTGHGGRVLDAPIDTEAESYDEVIVPTDYAVSGLIRDTLIFKTLLAPMRYGVTVTIMVDCCDTGMVMELPYSWSTKGDRRDSTAKLAMNEDFSFVRFLKVVKTLYETSTFTQLGRTVGSALNPAAVALLQKQDDKDAADAAAAGNGGANGASQDDTVKSDLVSPSGDSIFDAITDACNASQRRCVRGASGGKDGGGKGGSAGNGGKDKDGKNDAKLSLLEQVMNCTLLAQPGEEFSDDEDDTFHSPTEDHDSYYDGELGQSYETMTEDEGESRRTRNRRSKRG